MVSIIIPAYNEEKRIAASIEVIYKFLKSFKKSYEVLIVNDGSKDSTGKILKELQKKYNFRLINHTVNAGKGAAIKTGVNNASGEVILFTDTDLSVPIEFLDNYLEAMSKNTDIVIGTRAHRNSKVEVPQSKLRETLGEVFTRLANIILNVGVTDFTCGFKMFRKDAAEIIFNRQLINRWAFDAESLYIAKKYKFNIKEVPVVWRHREGSKVKFPRDLIETLISLIVIRFNDLKGKYN